MNIAALITAILCLGLGGFAVAGPAFTSDVIPTKAGDLTLTFIGHGTLMLRFDDKVIHVDPWTQQADYTTLPKADLILITTTKNINIADYVLGAQEQAIIANSSKIPVMCVNPRAAYAQVGQFMWGR